MLRSSLEDDGTLQEDRRVAKRPRTRGQTACENCRTRKTKCDAARPSCGQCEKLGRPCDYPDDYVVSSCELYGKRVLQAIRELSKLVNSQQHDLRRTQSSGVDDGHPQLWQQNSTLPQHSISGPSTSGMLEDSAFVPRRNIAAQGTDSILSWSIFAKYGVTSLPLENCSESDYALPNTLPSFDMGQLTPLIHRYVKGVHIMNPILDLNELHMLSKHVAEVGPDWTTGTCLIALVCAIGAINQLYMDYHLSPLGNFTPAARQSPTEHESNVKTATHYWSVAVRRLGIATGQNTVQAVQCLCLAGIFYMHRQSPVQAWKYFNLAGAAWHALQFRTRSKDVFQHVENSSSFNVMQSLYFTIWKSESELMIELDIPNPILDNAQFPHAFPIPPECSTDAYSDVADHERIWLYYLAEIAARHLISRVLRAYPSNISQTSYSSTTVDKMIDHVEIMRGQLEDWYKSLPAIFRFEIPSGHFLLPHTDELTQILRARYLTCKELLCRPFVKMCLEAEIGNNHTLLHYACDMATEDMRLCMLRLSQVAPHFHQGTWYGLRNFASSALLLIAVHLAKRNTQLRAVQKLTLPDGWREQIYQAMTTLQPLFNIGEGGAREIYQTVQQILDDT